jgi:hypothetical protein
MASTINDASLLLSWVRLLAGTTNTGIRIGF